MDEIKEFHIHKWKMPLKYIKICLSKDYMTKIKEKEKILILIIQIQKKKMKKKNYLIKHIIINLIWNLYLDILNNNNCSELYRIINQNDENESISCKNENRIY